MLPGVWHFPLLNLDSNHRSVELIHLARMKKLLIVVAAILLLFGGGWLSRPIYKNYKEKRFVAQAQSSAQKADGATAALFARQALQLNPTNPVSTRIMAELADNSNSPQVLVWRQRIVELEPTLENKIALGKASLRYEKFPHSIAEKMVRELAETGKTNSVYQSLAAELALKRGDFPQAELHFKEVLKLTPTNESAQVNLAVLQLESPDASTAAAARATLEKMQSSRDFGLRASRALVENHLRRSELDAAEIASKKLLADAGSLFIDRLVHLTILRRKQSPEFEPYLVSVEKDAANNAENVYKLVSWMNLNQLSDAALTWIKSLPADLQKQQPVPVAEADCYARKKDWSALENFLSAQKWGDRDFIRAAMLSRAFKEQRQSLAADVQWQKAIRLASEKLETLWLLVSIAEDWRGVEQREAALWAILEKFPRDESVSQMLAQSYYSRGNTRGLQKLYSRLAENGTQIGAQNNLALVSLLLGTNLEEAHRLARQVFQQEPKNASFLSTYAFSLHLQKKDADALKLLEQLSPRELENPSIALYYGIILVASEKQEVAQKYLKLAEGAPTLPEEKKLIALAREKL